MVQLNHSHSSNGKGRVSNRLLNAIADEEYAALEPHLEKIDMPRGMILYEPGDEIQWVYFPERAMISIVSLMENGATTEIGLIGKEGMVGISVLLGRREAVNRAIVQVPDGGIRIRVEVLEKAFREGGTLQQILLTYTRTMFMYVSQLAACNRHHKIEQRFARWLLHVSDSIDSNQLPLTQEFVAEMLGSRRSGVTVAAQALQREAIIQYRRGVITVLDRDRLEQETCECYQQIHQEFSQLYS
ncbi:MAG: Crp/Fnr family transcriptional regulator [Cyanobacteria bacterium P01_A01_bin.135]